MTTVAVKPHPDLDPAAWPLLVHPASGGLLDAQKRVPDDGRPWLNDGFTARLLTEAAILRADDPLFAERAAAEARAEAEAEAAQAAKLALKEPQALPPAAEMLPAAETPPTR